MKSFTILNATVAFIVAASAIGPPVQAQVRYDNDGLTINAQRTPSLRGRVILGATDSLKWTNANSSFLIGGGNIKPFVSFYNHITGASDRYQGDMMTLYSGDINNCSFLITHPKIKPIYIPRTGLFIQGCNITSDKSYSSSDPIYICSDMDILQEYGEVSIQGANVDISGPELNIMPGFSIEANSTFKFTVQ